MPAKPAMSHADIQQYSHSTWNVERPVTYRLLILRGLTVGGWVVAESILALAVCGLVWTQF